MIFNASDIEMARRLLNETIDVFGAWAPKTVERLNQEIRRRERVIRIFSNEESVIRLIGAVLMEIDEVWTTSHRYFDMAEYYEQKIIMEKRYKEVDQPSFRKRAARLPGR